jgi:hypothetical protein
VVSLVRGVIDHDASLGGQRFHSVSVNGHLAKWRRKGRVRRRGNPDERDEM